MKRSILLLVLVILSVNILYSKDKRVKFKGVTYALDLQNGTASVSHNYHSKLFNSSSYVGTLKGDVKLSSYVIYNDRNFIVTSIDIGAFMACDELISITIPWSISEIKYSPFSGASNLKNIYVDPENKCFASVDGILFSKDMSRIICYPQGRAESTYTVPNNVLIIDNCAFNSSDNLKGIVLPSSLKSIRNEAFKYSGIESIFIPDSVIEIDAGAFYWCDNLKRVVLPHSVRHIGSESFYYCSELSHVIYQNNELVFPYDVFLDCSKLVSDSIEYIVPKCLYLEEAQKGNIDYQYKVAVCYLIGDGYPKDYKSAKEWFERAAKANNNLAQKALGDIYIKAMGVKQDVKEAIKWYTLAANNGNAEAQSVLGDCYFYAIEVRQDYPKAIAFYKQASERGDIYAQEKLAYCYYNGKGGLKRDYEEAAKRYLELDKHGSIRASYYLAMMNYEGNGFEKNEDEALKWAEKAMNGGISEIQELYKLLVYNDAEKLMNAKSYSLAIDRFSTLLKYDTKSVNGYINRGYCYLNLPTKDYAKAEIDFKKALELDANNKIAQSNLEVVNAYYERIKEARRLCDEAYGYYSKGDYIKAAATCSKSIHLDDTKPYPYYLIGSCYFDCQSYPDAIKYFEKALAVDPNYSNAKDGISRARTIIICNALSETMSNLSAAINQLNNSVNYSNTSSSSSNSFSDGNGSSCNNYLESQANRSVDFEKKKCQDKYDMYMRLYNTERSEEDRYLKEYQNTGNISDLQRSKDCGARAKDYLDRANIYL